MITIGLAHDLFISSAAVVKDGKVVAAIAEERLNRQKQYKGFPALALKECLRMAGATLKDVSAIGFGWNPSRHIEFPNYRQSNNARFRAEYLYAVPNMVLGHMGQKSGEWLEQTLDGLDSRIQYYDHQLAHAANAFYLSGYDRAATFSADGRGERETAYWGSADRSSGLHKLGQVHFPHSLGLLYGSVTQYLGYRPDSDEWKVMALASYGEPNNRYYTLMRPLVEVDPETGQFYVDQKYFGYAEPEVYGGRFYTPEFVDRFGPPRLRDEDIEKRHHDIAWALQRVFEETMTVCLKSLHKKTGESHLVAAGGCLMNSVYNGKVTGLTPFKELFVSSCPDDSGISLGAALLAYHRLADKPQFVEHPHNYWGPSYDYQIADTLRNFKISFSQLENPSHTAAQVLADGWLLGWFQGAMEFGQRALGNRSILADPRRSGVKDLVNAAVKYRESFRPFAPAILAERVHEFFYAEPAGKAPFMERVYQFRAEMRDKVPAVVHVDGSGRLQSVERQHNPRFYDLIKEFEGLTGVPIVLNTSFNLNGEPIVCTPSDAIRTFFSCGLDALIIGDCLVRK
jgi:carbamoyltransferase